MHNTFMELMEELEKKSPKANTALLTALQMGEAKKGEYIAQVGKVNNRVILLNEGIIRHFRENTNGKEHTNWFSFSGDVVLAMSSLVHKTPAVEGLQALGYCSYIYINGEDLTSLMAKHHAFETLYRKLIEMYYIEMEERVYRMQTLSAKEKYQYLLKHKPHMIQRLPHNQIASYLGITKETLSRIKSN